MIGGGKMAEALLGGLVDRGWAAADELHVVEPVAERRALLATRHPSMSIGTEPIDEIDALIAVKPDVVAAVLGGLAKAGVTRVLSIAAGVRTELIEATTTGRHCGCALYAQHSGAGRQRCSGYRRRRRGRSRRS